MTLTLRKSIIIIAIIIGIIAISFCTFSVGVQGLFEISPIFYIATGNHLSGTVVGRDRLNGYSLVVSTEKFGEITVQCSASQYKEIAEGTDIDITYELSVKEKTNV